MDKNLKSLIIDYKKKIQNHLLFMRLVNSISETSINPLCPLCLVNEINIVYNKCGHTTCETCYNRTNKTNCSICRSTICSTTNLFIL